ncbi:MAG: hypothetical protein HY608_04085 [Planctomycetes bacterium]|nr:hypothetical protein [Planctomycetota bacterium]
MKRTDGIFEKYPTPEALIALCRPGGPDREGCDLALGAILRAMRSGNALFPLIHLMLWESLARLFRRLRKRISDQEELFERIQWEFFQQVTRHDPDRLPGKIDVILFLNTKREVIRWERGETERRAIMEEAAVTFSTVVHDDPVEPEPPFIRAGSFLAELVAAGVIREVERDVLLATDVQGGIDLTEWAVRRGMKFQTAASLRRRAREAIREYLLRQRRNS